MDRRCYTHASSLSWNRVMLKSWSGFDFLLQTLATTLALTTKTSPTRCTLPILALRRFKDDACWWASQHLCALTSCARSDTCWISDDDKWCLNHNSYICLLWFLATRFSWDIAVAPRRCNPHIPTLDLIMMCWRWASKQLPYLVLLTRSKTRLIYNSPFCLRWLPVVTFTCFPTYAQSSLFTLQYSFRYLQNLQKITSTLDKNLWCNIIISKR